MNLIKRLVMKRCVYGVDLNPMAVELAKVSLWLDSFTLGAPLSFLDHHLKCGNSLIGSTIADLKRTVEESGSLFAIPMEPLERATRNMELIANLTDATLDEVTKSADTYEQVLSGVKGYRALLDCLTAQHFGIRKAADVVVHAEHLGLKLDNWDRSLSEAAGDRNAKTLLGIVRDSQEAGKHRQFFHWDLGFPDVFFTSRRSESRRAFDAILGNPPYDELSEYVAGESLPEKQYLEDNSLYACAKGGRQNLFRFFIVRSATLLRENGMHGFIVPLALLTDQFTFLLRRWLLEKYSLKAIDQFPQKDDATRRVFHEAKLSTCVYSLAAGAPNDDDRVVIRTHPWNKVDPDSPLFTPRQVDFRQLDPETWSIPSYDPLEWAITEKLVKNRLVTRASTYLKAYPGEVMLNAQFQPYLAPKGQLLLRGAHVGRYEFHKEPKQGDPVYLNVDKYRRDKRDEGKAGHHLCDRVGFQRGSAIDNYRRLIACCIPTGQFCTDTVGYIVNPGIDLFAVLAWFNSAMTEWRFSRTSTNNHVNAYEVEGLPIPRLNPLSSRERQDAKRLLAKPDGLPDLAIAILKASSLPREGVEDGGPSVFHAALAASGETLARLGYLKEEDAEAFSQAVAKSAEIETVDEWTGSTRFRDLDYFGWDARFTAWHPDDATSADGRWFPNGVAPPLPGDGPGDIPWDLIARVFPSYPLPGIDAAAWEAAAWAEFLDLLRKNKEHIGQARIRADLTGRGAVENPTGPLRKLHETFLKYHRQVRENRAKAAEIDFLIDRIVFRLFDLTLDEQKLILSRVGPGRPLPPRRRRGGKAAKAKAEQGPGLFEEDTDSRNSL